MPKNKKEKIEKIENRKDYSEEIKNLSIKIEDLVYMIENLKIDDIDDLVKKTEKQIDYLKGIELYAAIMIKKLESHIIEIKNRLYLLDEEIASKVRERMIASERKFDKAKEDITKSAEKLIKDIKTVYIEEPVDQKTYEKQIERLEKGGV